MTRSIADIVADLRTPDWTSFENLEMIDEAADLLEHLDALRPTCPTCDGNIRIPTRAPDFSAGPYKRCPDCADGRMSWDRMAAIVGRVIDIATQPQSPGTETTLTDWLMCKDVRP